MCVLDRSTTLRDAYSDIVQAGRGSRYSFTYPLVTLALSWQLATRGIRLAKDRTGVNTRANVDEVTSPSVPTPCTCTEDLSMNEGGICV